ncbi:putative membrane protein [Actinokineospora spheciospongiae]|uniref:Putative membrane protein n=1 Tax=Actinokineospora spheciospongiae TaxID=909613 RepID=W7ICK5_9PSEU|nr:putative membrane protein [Actinokineospora spheciospongiae]
MEQLTPVPGEAEKRRALRTMKLVALSFLGAATLIFLATVLWPDPPAWVGYVRAAAEAGMVGALADWFAVTALFRRPMGLPIPHTAIIPTKKDVLGDSLGDFVGSNFLSESVVRDRLRRVGVAGRLGGWLAQPDNAERITSELATVLRGAVTVLRDEDVQAVMEQAVVTRVVNVPWGPPLGKLLQRVFDDGTHHRLVDLICDQAYEWVSRNHDQVMRVVSNRAPSWSPKFVDALVADRVYEEVLTFAWNVKTDVNHPMRAAVDKFLHEFAGNLQTDPKIMERAELVKHQVLEHPAVKDIIGRAWTTAKRMLLDAAEDPSSELRTRVRTALTTLGDRLANDTDLRTKADGWVEGAAAYVVLNYRDEITTLITDTVHRWDAEETSQKIELQVGRDLQFIRINGTVVGALAGLLIYTVAQFIS